MTCGGRGTCPSCMGGQTIACCFAGRAVLPFSLSTCLAAFSPFWPACCADSAMPCPCLPCLQSLEHEIANFGKERDNRVKAAQAKIAAAKKAVEGAKKALKAKQAAMQVRRLQRLVFVCGGEHSTVGVSRKQGAGSHAC